MRHRLREFGRHDRFNGLNSAPSRVLIKPVNAVFKRGRACAKQEVRIPLENSFNADVSPITISLDIVCNANSAGFFYHPRLKHIAASDTANSPLMTRALTRSFSGMAATMESM